MTCQCGEEKFNIIKVIRNRRLVKGKFKCNDAVDSRIIICSTCGERYITETRITYRITYRNYKTIVKNRFTNQECIFDWEEAIKEEINDNRQTES